jgi:hypothetical protein
MQTASVSLLLSWQLGVQGGTIHGAILFVDMDNQTGATFMDGIRRIHQASVRIDPAGRVRYNSAHAYADTSIASSVSRAGSV